MLWRSRPGAVGGRFEQHVGAGFERQHGDAVQTTRQPQPRESRPMHPAKVAQAKPPGAWGKA
ncbi:hypothetical protein Acsp04_43550 [Actinomadura sp. NBRC 104425]|nr:hypothetical protein Acsp04_43550 [Actinomadura sp. NBRC 104425]